MKDLEFGTVKIHLEELMKERNISINKLSFRAEMQRTQLKNYCKKQVQRLDIAVLSRLCYALDCDLNDLLEYVPPEKRNNTTKERVGFSLLSLSLFLIQFVPLIYIVSLQFMCTSYFFPVPTYSIKLVIIHPYIYSHT